MSDDYLWSRSGPPDPDVEKLERLLEPLAHDDPLEELRLRRKRPRWPWFIACIAGAAAAALAIYIALPKQTNKQNVASNECRSGNGFAFAAIDGDVSCGGARLAKGVLPVGGELDTGAH